MPIGMGRAAYFDAMGGLEQTRRVVSLRVMRLCLAVLASCVALAFLGDLTTLTLQVPKNYNEGWNAYHAVATYGRHSWPLYPGPRSLLSNNYPPLSFLIVGALTRVLGDAIIAGRLVALLAAPGIAVMLIVAARRMGCSRGESAVAALLFLASPWTLTRFAAIDDPQLLGNFLDAAALALLLRTPLQINAIVAAALLLISALFIKPLFIALPLASIVWLWGRERRHAILLTALCFLFGSAGLLATRLFLHVDLLPHILAPRLFHVGKMVGQPGQWLACEALPLLASLWLWKAGRFGRLIALYAGMAFLLLIYFSGGEGVSASPAPEASMAVSLGMALFLARTRDAALPLAGWTPLLVGMSAVLSAFLLVASLFGRWVSGPSPALLMQEQTAARYDVVHLARVPGPALCEDLALCYWANKTPELSSFGLVEAFRLGVRPESDVIRLLDRHRYGIIELSRKSNFAYSPTLMAAFARDYRVDHQDALGRFLIPVSVRRRNSVPRENLYPR